MASSILIVPMQQRTYPPSIMAKVGRNDPCPCGSGRKFKKCCDSGSAAEVQRRRQQGFGNPIDSHVLPTGERVVVASGRRYASTKWRTFREFLIDYLPSVFGEPWWSAELAPLEQERHPVVKWHGLLAKLRPSAPVINSGLTSAPMTGAAAVYLRLSYDLYTLAHNAEVSAVLVQRLKNPEQFPGAHYEAHVAAALIRAGFDLAFEDERDRRTSHCEFTATSKQSGCRFSVEAKHREPCDEKQAAEGRLRVRKRLHNALGKRADHQRVVFIDVNVPDAVADDRTPAFLHGVLADLRTSETKPPGGVALPPAYIFVTNHPFQYDLEGTRFRTAVLAEGFNIPDFKSDAAFHDVRDVLKSRAKHADMHRLLSSLQEHAEIPATFDGDIPELAFSEDGGANRLIIGRAYLVPHGAEMVRGTLVSAAVAERERLAYGAYKLDDGQCIMVTCPLSAAEMEAYRRFPDTFFGVIQQKHRTVRSAMEMFDFIYDSYKHTPKETLLRFLEGAPDLNVSVSCRRKNWRSSTASAVQQRRRVSGAAPHRNRADALVRQGAAEHHAHVIGDIAGAKLRQAHQLTSCGIEGVLRGALGDVLPPGVLEQAVGSEQQRARAQRLAERERHGGPATDQRLPNLPLGQVLDTVEDVPRAAIARARPYNHVVADGGNHQRALAGLCMDGGVDSRDERGPLTLVAHGSGGRGRGRGGRPDQQPRHHRAPLRPHLQRLGPRLRQLGLPLHGPGRCPLPGAQRRRRRVGGARPHSQGRAYIRNGRRRVARATLAT